MVTPSIVPPSMFAVVTVPRSAMVFPALVQSSLMLNDTPSSADMVSNAISPTLRMF